MIFVAAVLLGFAFGAADQYLGSLRSLVTLGPWAPTVSVMSAPWLIVPFAFGCTQTHRRRAMQVGLVATWSALAGYFALTLSPLEGVPLSRFPADLVSLVGSGQNMVYIVAGAVTGPLYGLLGASWRVQRSWAAAVMVAGALCLEPAARWAVGQLSAPRTAWDVEVAMGTAAAAFFTASRFARRRSSTAAG